MQCAITSKSMSMSMSMSQRVHNPRSICHPERSRGTSPQHLEGSSERAPDHIANLPWTFGVFPIRREGSSLPTEEKNSCVPNKSRSEPARRAPLHREPRDLPGVFQVQLLFNMSAMRLDRFGTEVQSFSDGFDFFALANPFQDLQLAIG